jgi:hypothetical protein
MIQKLRCLRALALLPTFPGLFALLLSPLAPFLSGHRKMFSRRRLPRDQGLASEQTEVKGEW